MTSCARAKYIRHNSKRNTRKNKLITTIYFKHGLARLTTISRARRITKTKPNSFHSSRFSWFWSNWLVQVKSSPSLRLFLWLLLFHNVLPFFYASCNELLLATFAWFLWCESESKVLEYQRRFASLRLLLCQLGLPHRCIRKRDRGIERKSEGKRGIHVSFWLYSFQLV